MTGEEEQTEEQEPEEEVVIHAVSALSVYLSKPSRKYKCKCF